MPASTIGVLFMLLAGLILAYGLFLLWKPEQAWFWSRGWEFKNVEPSNRAINAMEVSGCVVLLMGIGVLVLGIFMFAS